MRRRVYVETSVLVSASIYAASEKTPVKLKHVFFDESSELFGLIRKHYRGTEGPTEMFLASCDTLLAPKKMKAGGYSSKVTDRLKQRFDLQCAWPHQICSELAEL